MNDFSRELLVWLVVPLLVLMLRVAWHCRYALLCLAGLALLGLAGLAAVRWSHWMALPLGTLPGWWMGSARSRSLLRLFALGIGLLTVSCMPAWLWWTAFGTAILYFDPSNPGWLPRAPLALDDRRLAMPVLACLGVFRLGAPLLWAATLLVMMLVPVGHLLTLPASPATPDLARPPVRSQPSRPELPQAAPVWYPPSIPRPAPGVPEHAVWVIVANPSALILPIRALREELSGRMGFELPVILLRRSSPRWSGDYRILVGHHLEWLPYLNDQHLLNRLEWLLVRNREYLLPSHWGALRWLAQEGVDLSDRQTIDRARQPLPAGAWVEETSEAVRLALGEQLVAGHLDGNGNLPVITLSHRLERQLVGHEFVRAPLRDHMVRETIETLAAARQLRLRPVLLTVPMLRRRLWLALNEWIPGLVVLSTAEVPSERGVAMVAVLPPPS